MASAPVVSSINFDQPSYLAGQKITVTVDYEPGMSDQTQTFTGVADDSATGLSGELVVNFIVTNNDTTNLTVSDSGNRTWSKVSDSGTVAVFTGIA